jgi:hypothetical protein
VDVGTILAQLVGQGLTGRVVEVGDNDARAFFDEAPR